MYEPAEIQKITPIDDFVVRFEFGDGTIHEIDITQHIEHGKMFEPIRNDPAFFRSAYVENGTITWPNGADIDPDVLYLGLPPNASEEAYWAARRRVEQRTVPQN